MRILCELMGVPLEDRRHLVELGNRMLGNTDPDHAGEFVAGRGRSRPRYAHLPFSSPAAPEMFAYANALAARATPASPRDDLTTPSARGRDRRRPAVRARVRSVLPAAGDRRQRDDAPRDVQRAAGAARASRRSATGSSPTPRLIPTAVEEILRWAPSLLHFRRTATRDVELRGQTIRAGRQGRAVVRLGQSRRGSVPRRRAASTSAASPTGTSPSASAAPTSASAPTSRGSSCASGSRRCCRCWAGSSWRASRGVFAPTSSTA